jgi:transcription initiation factor TFIID subunit 7
MAGLLSAASAGPSTGTAPGPKKQTVRKKRTPAVISTKIKISTAAAASTSKKKSKKDKRLDEVSEAPIEDHIILRLPPSVATTEFRAAVKKRQIPPGFTLNFSEPRTASVRLGVGPEPKESLTAKLVDLPCIIE